MTLIGGTQKILDSGEETKSDELEKISKKSATLIIKSSLGSCPERSEIVKL